MNKRISVGVAAAIAMIAVTITFAATLIFSMSLFDQKVAGYRERAVMYDKIGEIDALVRENFYMAIDDNNVEDNTISGYMAGLGDGNSKYLTAEEYAASLVKMSGKELSFGFTVEENSLGYMEIRSVIPGSRADNSGLLAGDLISMIGDEPVTTSNYDEMVALMNVSEGTTLSFGINRDGQETNAELTYERLDATAVTSFLMGNDVGYLRILNFTETAPAQFENALQSLIGAEVKGLVFDLRSCRADYYSVETLSRMLDSLITTPGTMISGQYADGTVKLLATSNAEGLDMPMVLLVNEHTEYFAELFAAVLRDTMNVPIVGAQTAGHGTYQTTIVLSDGSAIAVSTAVLLTPVSGSFNETGIMPDYLVARDVSLLTDYAEPSESEDAQYSRAQSLLRSMM